MATSYPITDPIAFVEDLTRGHLNERTTDAEDAAEVARYYQLRTKLLALVPDLTGPGDAATSFTVMDETVHAIWSGASQKGKRMGAAMEYLHHASLSPASLCPECFGEGNLRRKGEPGATCFKCMGSGTVPTEGYWPCPDSH